MKKNSLFIPFLLALSATLVTPIYFPGIRLVTFAPFLALLFLRDSFYRSLVISITLGLFLDLLSSHFRFGTHALSYAAATAILYFQRIHFFEDRPLSFCLFSSLIASVVTFCQLVLLSIFSKRFHFTLLSFFTDVVVSPLFDGLYAFLWFTCPLLVVILAKRTVSKLFRSPYRGR